MVISSLGNMEITTVIAVNVVWTVVFVGGIECTHTSGTTKNIVRFFQTFQRTTWSEKFWSDDHGDGKIRSELVICPSVVGLVEIFIDTAAIE